MNPYIVCVTSQKGGVGKTTTAVTLAHGCALAGLSVLLVDLDGQGQAAVALGRDPEPGLYRYVDPVVREPLANVTRATGRTGLWLLPGDSSTRRLEVMARFDVDGFEALRDRLDAASQRYDVVVLDTAAQGILQEVGLWIASLVVVPARLEALGVDGVHQTAALSAKLGAAPLVVQPVAFDCRLNEHKAQLTTLAASFGAQVLPPVPARVAVPECHACGLTVYESQAPGAEDVAAVYDGLVGVVQSFRSGVGAVALQGVG